MFFCKKKFLDSGLLASFTDFHSHILPGVDDGVKTLNEAIEVMNFYESVGVKRIFLTPHIMEDYPLNTAVFLKERLEEFRRTYNGNISIELGAEYMLDSGFAAHMNTGKMLTIVGTHILVETSCIYKPLNFIQILKEIHSKGYHIILAHPERYKYMEKADYELLKGMNVKFQLNLLSLFGVYGKNVTQTSHKLLKQGYYDCIGSDLHNLRFFRNVIESRKLPKSIITMLKQVKSKSL